MKKFILILLISIFSYTNSFSLSKKGEKEMYGGCYPEALHLGKKRAKQYCTCAVKMVSKKYSDFRRIACCPAAVFSQRNV